MERVLGLDIIVDAEEEDGRGDGRFIRWSVDSDRSETERSALYHKPQTSIGLTPTAITFLHEPNEFLDAGRDV